MLHFLPRVIGEFDSSCVQSRSNLPAWDTVFGRGTHPRVNRQTGQSEHTLSESLVESLTTGAMGWLPPFQINFNNGWVFLRNTCRPRALGLPLRNGSGIRYNHVNHVVLQLRQVTVFKSIATSSSQTHDHSTLLSRDRSLFIFLFVCLV